MNPWAALLTDLEHADFELRRCTDPAALARWAQQRADLMDRLKSLSPESAGHTEQVRLSAALVRGQELLGQWSRDRVRLRAEAGNLHASRQLLQALQPARPGAHFSFDT